MLATILAAAVAALGANDCSYYRFSGKGETFVMKTASVTADVAARQKFWQQVAANTMPVIYQLTFPKTPGWKQKLPKTSAEAISAIDGFFAAGDGVEPCPERIFAVTPCEENVTWDGQTEVQDAIAKHLKGKYGVKTYQWLTEPLKPTLGIQADGWVFDAYCITDPTAFYSHLEAFLLTGLPVVPCIWASGHFSGYHKNKTWDALTRFTVERMDMCRAFGMPVLLFAVAGPGSVGYWFKEAKEPGERYYREVVKHYMASVPTMPEASWKAPRKEWRMSASDGGKVKARIDLTSFDLVRETMFDNVRKWKLTKEGLSLVGGKGSLKWSASSVGRVEGGVFTLRHSPGAKGVFCGKPLSEDGVTKMETQGFHSRNLSLEAEGGVVLRELAFEGRGEYFVAEVELEMDTSYGRTDYRRKIAFESGEASLCGVKGRAATRRIVRKINFPGHESCKVMADAEVVANKASYGGSVTMTVSLDGVTPFASASSDPAKGAKQVISLTGDTPDTPWSKQGMYLPRGTESCYIIFDLRVGCGIDTTNHSGAQVLSCDFRIRPCGP